MRLHIVETSGGCAARRPAARWACAVLALALASLAQSTAAAQGDNQPPRANFQSDPERGEVPLTVAFTDGSSDSDGEVVRFRWDFGDGTTSDARNPTHTYTAPGTFEVSLTVTDDRGASAAKAGEFIIVDPPRLAAAVLPASRSVLVGQAATAFVTVINPGAITATGVGISIHPSTALAPLPATLAFQTTDPLTNQVTGAPGVPVDIPPGGSQSYVVTLVPSSPFGPTDVRFEIDGPNTVAARIIPGIDTLLLVSSTTPTPDVIALASTVEGGGIARIGASGVAAFSVATFNAGAPGTITASADTGSATLPLAIALCRTDAATAQCLSAPAPSVAIPMGSGEPSTFAVFLAASAPIPYDPADNRVFVRFTDEAGVTRGATSVAVRHP